jgi:hypothetical protein
MHTKPCLILGPLGVAALLLASACHSTQGVRDSGAADGHDAAPNTDGAQDIVTPPPPDTSPLGAPCGADSDCDSDFCVDGVCCDAACDQPCYACAQAASLGICAPVRQDEDLVATSPCAGASRCVLDRAGVAACKLRDKQSCSSNDQCVSGFCRTYFVDADGDGFGVASAHQAICDAAAATPPPGYAALAGDCCDSDGNASPEPSQNGYFTTPNMCGSFDWNCDGVVERYITACVGASGSATGTVACGAPCYVALPGSLPRMVTQGCR